MSVSSSFSGFLKTCNRLYFRRGREFDFNVGLLSKKIWPKTWPLNFQKHVHPNVDLYLATSLLKIQETQGPIGQHVEWDQWGDSPKKRRLDYDGNGMPKRPRPRRDDFMPGSPTGNPDGVGEPILNKLPKSFLTDSDHYDRTEVWGQKAPEKNHVH